MKQEKFTVVIPTRERCETLLYTLRTCAEQDYENFDIVVSDNASMDRTREIVESFHDPRIRYVNTGRRMSMSENFDFGLSQVSEGFVMIMGDDDGLFPGAIQRVWRIIREYQVKAVVSSSCSYVWPNHQDKSLQNSMSWNPDSSIVIRDSKAWIEKMLSFRPFYTFDLPGLYMGFVHIDIVKSMTIDSTFFRSMTPDAYSAFACAVALDKYAFSGRPFCIAGASGRSNGASYWRESEKTEAESFFKENTLEFHPSLRICPSYRVIAAEAFLRLKEAFPEKSKQYQLDIRLLLSSALAEASPLNKQRIKEAVFEMAVLHGIDPETLHPTRPNSKDRILRLIRNVIKSPWLITKYCGIDNTSLFNVTNIHDAARVANVFLDINEGVKAKKIINLAASRFLNFFK
jgi:glycosyltransferase involved in cell wall biosynthesis